MRHALIALSILLGTATPAMAQVSVTVAIPGVSIGINQPVYPELVLVPGYPVYYAPQVQANYFFYDGLYWVYQDDRWYVSSWYNGPWDLVEPDDVPLFVLRVPVQYYVRPPVYFSGWVVTSAPLWHLHWGPRWTHYRPGWDHWDRRVVYRPAPLPVYQRHYAGDRYPRREYQRVIRHEHYHYQPRDQMVRRHDQQRAAPRPQVHAQPNRPDVSREQRPQREREESRRTEPKQASPRQQAPAAQEQRQPSRQEPERRAQPQPQRRPDVPRAQSAPREREDARRPEAMQLLPQQRAATMQERQQQQRQQQQQQRQEQAQRAQQAPAAQQAPRPQQVPRMQQPPRPQQVRPQQALRPQQAQERQPRGGGGDAHQSRGNAERRQGSGGDRGPGR